MSDNKLQALKAFLDTPTNFNKLLIYEQKIKDFCTFILLDLRKIIFHLIDINKSNSDLNQQITQIRKRIDHLIDTARDDIQRFPPNYSEKTKKNIINNCLIFDFIIFSRCWDLKEELKNIDSQIIFEEAAELKILIKKSFENTQIIDELFLNKNKAKTITLSDEELVKILYERFNKELEFVESIGALKGILKLEKPKIFGKGKYYEQLGNIILKIVLSLSEKLGNEPIPIRTLMATLNSNYPRIQADIKSVIKTLEILAQNGFLILKQESDGLYWIAFQPSESEANIILKLAESKGFLTIEDLMMKTSWPLKKAIEELEKFVKAGCALKDTNYATGVKYYFPGLSENIHH